ncbi:ABC-2 type transport system permease protein [Paenibacillus sp. UNCCL117]|uniref:ABC transporter permease n=1 Tax=unclassified Paenibacillus TaxID=185978 RepID=UPI0008912728|nr:MULTISPECIES: ABC transporter permease [unclassified Paenibacillus]SDC15519.1 ABC-2 type transport system permease protein [Paenibacillus sp. cl123]SFW17569.1 ABC-2 type transport system permease protein [Paenibacillus sp. UNCCL117]
MGGFKAAFLNEAVKMLKKKKLIAAAILSILAVVIGQVAVTVIKHGLGLRVVGSTEFPLVVLSIFAYTILPLFATFVAIDMFSGEFSSNTMKITLTRPVTRLGVFSAKVLNLAAFIMGNLLFVMVLSLLAGFLFNMTSVSFIGIVRVVLSYIATFLPIFVFSLLVVLLSNMLRGGLAVFFLAILAFLALNVLGIVFSGYSSFFITSMFDWYTLWISETINAFKILRQLLIMSGCGIMLFTAGYYLFDRKDI